MKAWLVKMSGPTRDIGIVVATDLEDLFWTIDEFSDPYIYEFCSARPGDAVFHGYTEEEDGIVECSDDERCDYLSAQVCDSNRRRWHRFASVGNSIPCEREK